jgi:hypothetical protein
MLPPKLALVCLSHNDYARVLWKLYRWIKRAHQSIFDNPAHGQRMTQGALEELLHGSTSGIWRQLRGAQLRCCRDLLIAKSPLRASIVRC